MNHKTNNQENKSNNVFYRNVDESKNKAPHETPRDTSQVASFSLENVNVVVPHSPISNEVTENLGHAPAQEQDPHRSIHPEGMNVHQRRGQKGL